MRLMRLLVAGTVVAAMLPPAASFADAQQGRKAWMKYNCYGCHGNNGAGGMGPNIQHAENGDVSEAMNGDATEGGMRSFKGIATAADATSIATYLGTIGTPSEPKWLDWWNH